MFVYLENSGFFTFTVDVDRKRKGLVKVRNVRLVHSNLNLTFIVTSSVDDFF